MARIIASVSAENAAKKYMPPVLSGLESWHFLNESLEKAARNYAPGKPDGSIVGSPVMTANYAKFKGLANFVQTQFEEPLEGTYFCVCKTSATLANDANRPMYYGTFRSAAASGDGETFGVSLTWNTTPLMAAYVTRGTNIDDDQSAPRTINVTDKNAWALITVVTPNGSGTIVKNETTGEELVGNITVPRFRSTGKFRLGSGYNTYGGECDEALFAGYSRVLNAEERNSTVLNIRAYMARRGIVV